MLVYEFKVKGKPTQYQAIDQAIWIAQFVANKCWRYWMDNNRVSRGDLYRYNRQLRAEFPFVAALNSHAYQASLELCWSGMARFYDNCKKQISGNKGFPKFRKHSRSVDTPEATRLGSPTL
ncbi:transposase [Microseira sp. BLCC-F43]|jgi:putative transposase|uniref:transposase n=1 Tax=Microseira sp. BLCC-F43 TaxID=3153602 RepID=UPI0035B7DDA1